MTTGAPRTGSLLVVHAGGLRLEDALLADTPFLHGLAASASVVERLHRSPARCGALFDDGVVETVRDLGLDVDRRALVLRPPGRGDDAVLAALEHRPAGPADVTLLELRDVAAAAANSGPGSPAHRAALRALEGHVRRALAALVRDGAAPELWLVAEGPLQPVQRTVDAAAEMARFLRGRRRDVVLRGTTGWLLVESDDGTLVRRLAGWLCDGPLAAHGDLLDGDRARALGLSGRHGMLRFAARDGVAFATRPQRGVLPWLPRAPRDAGFAFVPGLRARRRDLDEHELVARLLARAGALVAGAPIAGAPVAGAPAARAAAAPREAGFVPAVGEPAAR